MKAMREGYVKHSMFSFPFRAGVFKTIFVASINRSTNQIFLTCSNINHK